MSVYVLSIGEGNDGVGDVCLQTYMGMSLLLKGFMHAPRVFFFNLIFVHVLDDECFYNHFFSRKCKLNKGNLIVVREEIISKLYWTNFWIAKDIRE